MGLFYRIMYIVIAIILHVVGGSLVISAFRDSDEDVPRVLGVPITGLVGLAMWLMTILATFWFFEMLFLYDWSIG